MNKFSFQIALISSIFLLNGCASIMAETSGGANVETVSHPGSQGSSYGLRTTEKSMSEATPEESVAAIAFSYQSTIGFNKNIYPSVDLIFSRMLNGDQDLQQILQEFIEPGYRLLEQKYGLVLRRPELQADAKVKRIFFKGRSGPVSEVTSANHVVTLLGIGKKYRKLRMASSVDEGIASFNSLRPRNVDIKTLLSIRIEYFDESMRSWVPASPDQQGKNQLAKALTEDLRAAYYEFLSKNYNVKITSSFKGFDG